jgi:glycosyltransferase involved in cell wall biosynthesis
LAAAYRELGFPVESAGGENGAVLALAERVGAIARKRRAICLQSHNFRESIVGSLVRLRRRAPRHIFRVHTYIDCSWIPVWKKWAYHILAGLTQGGVDRFLPITHAAQRELVHRSGISPRKVAVIPDGVARLGPPDAANSSNAPLPAKLAMVSNLLDHKGHDVLVRGLVELKRRGLTVKARLVGGERAAARHGQGGIGCHSGRSAWGLSGLPASACGPFSERLRAMASQAGVLDQLDFHGFTRDVYSAIRGYPVVVLPSESEGIPNSILEAMSVRKLVVAASVGGVPEVITEGHDGLLHPPKDPVALADALYLIFTTPACSWENMRDHAQRTWESRFSVEVMRHSLRRAYQQLGVG